MKELVRGLLAVAAIMLMLVVVSIVMEGKLMTQAVAREIERKDTPAEALENYRNGRRGNPYQNTLGVLGLVAVVGGAGFGIIQYNKSKTKRAREERLAKKSKHPAPPPMATMPQVLLNVPRTPNQTGVDEVPDINAGQHYGQLPSGHN